jgi:hypothetical protein
MEDSKQRNALVKIADDINLKRKNELLHFSSSNSEIRKYIQSLKNSHAYEKGSKSKVWRKVASMPDVVDKFFSDTYGKDYYKDKEFFTKHHPEWAVFNPSKN